MKLDVQVRLKDMRGVVHFSGAIENTKLTWCERIYEENWYSHASLRWTSEPMTCLLCLGRGLW